VSQRHSLRRPKKMQWIDIALKIESFIIFLQMDHSHDGGSIIFSSFFKSITVWF